MSSLYQKTTKTIKRIRVRGVENTITPIDSEENLGLKVL